MLQDIPVQHLEACAYSDLGVHSVVINLLNLEYEVWIHIPSFCRGCRLFQIDEFLPENREAAAVLASARQEPGKPWIRITPHSLNISPAYHSYRLHFINCRTDDVFSLYIAYIIQDDNPEKPYVYMNESREHIQ